MEIPKSEFIKKKIKETLWKDRKYIEDLIRIERYALGEYFGWVTGYIVADLKENYPKEWEIIHQELNPKGYKKMLEQAKKERENEKREGIKIRKEETEEEKRDLREWKKLGGKV
ncbi:MAG: hypothetical protein KAT28_03790 [Candidatus Aenigmarchaeota archaeon]|nr:hypothetical protein [Candidatus Aenigmarchaeota archaeon]